MFKKSKKNPESKYTIEDIRAGASEMLSAMQEVESEATPPIVQEVILARRHVENARMRLGVALALQNGHDPWASEVAPKENTNG